jgi:hypothetical protein
MEQLNSLTRSTIVERMEEPNNHIFPKCGDHSYLLYTADGKKISTELAQLGGDILSLWSQTLLPLPVNCMR